MVEFSIRFSIYEFLHLPELLHVYRNDDLGWIMKSHMYDFVLEKMKEIIEATWFILVICDEAIVVDNCSYLCIHVQ